MIDNYANFNGRARRKEYWMWYLFYLIVLIVATFLDNIFGTVIDGVVYGWLYVLTGLIHFIPGFAVAIRRLHDVGKSGWFLLIGFIPLIGAIWLLVLFCSEGDCTENAYGSDPKSESQQ